MLKSKYGHRTINWLEAVVNRIGGEDRAEALLRGDIVITEPSPTRRLKHRGTAECKSVKRFEGKQSFRLGTFDGLKIGYMGDVFKKVILPLIEDDVVEATLNGHELLTGSFDLDILKEIPSRKEITKAAHLHYLLTLQGEGQDGVLLTNGYANIFYMIGTDGNLWTVFAHWRGGGWRLYADPVEGPDGWGAGYRVFSR